MCFKVIHIQPEPVQSQCDIQTKVTITLYPPADKDISGNPMISAHILWGKIPFNTETDPYIMTCLDPRDLILVKNKNFNVILSILQASSAEAAGILRGKIGNDPPLALHTDNFLNIAPILMLSLHRCFKLTPLTDFTHFLRIFGRACA